MFDGWAGLANLKLRVDQSNNQGVSTMGKVKKRRNISHKNVAPPTGGPSQAEIDDAMEGLDDEVDANEASDAATTTVAARGGKKQVPDFLSGLTNLQGSVREATCVALASFFAGEGTPDKLKMLDKLLNAGLLKKLLPRVVDPSTLVRLHALGALRNISAFGGLDVSESMTSEDILTPCVKIVGEYAVDNVDGKASPHAVPILEQVFALLTNLCESCSLALVQATHQRHALLPALLHSLHVAKQPALHLETMKLLLVLCDNNPDLSQSFPAEFPPALLQILQSPEHSTKLRLTTIGVAINLPDVLENAQSVGLLLPVLQSAVAYDPIGVVGQAQAASEQWDLAQQDYGTVEFADEDVEEREHVEKVKKAVAVVRSWRENVHILTLGLELLSNMLANVELGDDDDEWGSDDEDGMEEAAQTQGNTATSRPVSVPAQVFGAENILPHVYLTRGCDLNQVFQVVLALYADVQTKNELALSKDLFQPDRADKGDVDAAVMAVLSALVLRSVDDNLPLNVAPEHLGAVLASAQASPSVEARTSAVRLLGTLGKKAHSLPENKVLAVCLSAVLRDTDLAVVCEVLNALFDIYADEQYDSVFHEVKFLTSLEHVGAGMKSKIKSEAKSLDRELVAHAKETRLNLLRFIKYKKQHLK
ncbi:hypothetical protein DYB38_003873 [Aphanomyces astaci]|uniref:SYO1-like TPR repeats domain-containing protein n=2 Tax=Aphanomyces astaci TaxID=112090 RepID=A0A397D229_APHAT|nr:hypothetical protein DYB38_003873 [Aphanomyces astaci]